MELIINQELVDKYKVSKDELERIGEKALIEAANEYHNNWQGANPEAWTGYAEIRIPELMTQMLEETLSDPSSENSTKVS